MQNNCIKNIMKIADNHWHYLTDATATKKRKQSELNMKFT